MSQTEHVYTLRRLSPDDGRDVYDMLQSMPPEGDTTNKVYGITFEQFKLWLLEREDMAEGVGLQPGGVRQTTFWFHVDGVPVGRLNVRHALNDELREHGGNIGYFIAPAYRRRGHGERMLKAGLDEARKAGLTEALLTIREDNLASRRVTEKNGGELREMREGICYYWIRL